MGLDVHTQTVATMAPIQLATKSQVRFSDLPTDLKALIVSHVARPTDMRKLCLTCKQLHEITVRQLYYEVAFDLGRPSDINISAFLSPTNIGLQHIRNLELYIVDIGDDKCYELRQAILQQAHFATRMILEFLPKNILKRFSWHPWETFSADNLALLYRRQKKMEWFEGISLDREIWPSLEKQMDLDEVFANGRRLGMFPDSTASLDFCHKLLVKTPKVEKIILHSNFPLNREVNDSSTGPGLITRTLFSHMQPFNTCTPLALKDITLQSVSLRYAAETYCRVINFRTISDVRIFNCPGADAFLAELSKGTQLPEKLETFEFKHDDNPENDGLSALDGFLCLVSGIRSLIIDLCDVKALPAAAGITRHAKTLNSLNIHANNEGGSKAEEHVYDYTALQQILKDCSLLEQLSIAFPANSIMRATTGTDGGMMYAYDVADLKHLVTLNITTWPTNTPSSSILPREVYEYLLARIATGFFQRAAHARRYSPDGTYIGSSKLNIVAFGSSDKCFEREESQNLVTFVKGRQIDPLAREEIVAIRCSWNERKFVESRSDILDFSLSKSMRPPTRKNLFAGGVVDGDSDSD